MGVLGLRSILKQGQGGDISSAVAGVKIGDRVLASSSDDVRLTAAIAVRAGLSGRVVLYAETEAQAADRVGRVEAAGALAEPFHGRLTSLPFDDAAFDLALVEETLDAMPSGDRAATAAELLRVVRPGGRVLWIEKVKRTLWRKNGHAQRTRAAAEAREQQLHAAGFRGVRTLAVADGRAYTEGIKAASSA